MNVEIIKKTKEVLGLQWSDEALGHGQLIIKYDGKGGYNIDTEYLGIETMLKILKEVKLKS